MSAFSNEKGNGGVSYVCRDQNNQIIKARLLDLWEPETFESHSDNSVDAKTQLDEVIRRISSFHPKTSKIMSTVLEDIQKTTIYTAKALPLSNDALPDFVPGPGCGFEQVAIFGFSNEFNDKRLRVHKEIFFSPVFSESDKAALMLHEVLYFLDSNNNSVENSRNVRRVVARLFSNTEVPQSVKRDLIEIVGKTNKSQLKNLSRTIPEPSDKKNTFKIFSNGPITLKIKGIALRDERKLEMSYKVLSSNGSILAQEDCQYSRRARCNIFSEQTIMLESSEEINLIKYIPRADVISRSRYFGIDVFINGEQINQLIENLDPIRSNMNPYYYLNRYYGQITDYFILENIDLSKPL